MGVLRFVWIAEGRAWVDIGEWNGRVMAVFVLWILGRSGVGWVSVLVLGGGVFGG